jgi:vacuolar-type H+-ATPase subunit H
MQSAVLVFLLLATPANAFWELIAGGVVSFLVGKGLVDEAKGAVSFAIADADRRVKERIDQLGDRADQSIRIAGDEMRKNLREAERILNDAIDKTNGMVETQRKEFFRKLAEERKEFFTNMDVLMARIEGTGNAWLDRFDKSANNLLRQAATELDSLEIVIENIRLTPLASREQKLTRLYGSGRVYKSDGTYDFRAVGYGFGDEGQRKIEDMQISLGRLTVSREWQRFDRSFTRLVAVPVKLVNGSFSDVTAMPLDMSFKAKDLYSERTVILFPKFPVKYRLNVERADNTVSQAYVSSPGSDFLDAEEALVRRLAQIGSSNSAGVTQESVEHAVRTRLGEILSLMRERLPFGSFSVNLPVGSSWKDLEVTWFNGDRGILHRSATEGLGVRVSPEPAVIGQRLRIDVGLPTGF